MSLKSKLNVQNQIKNQPAYMHSIIIPQYLPARIINKKREECLRKKKKKNVFLKKEKLYLILKDFFNTLLLFTRKEVNIPKYKNIIPID